jgi:hypothetical protein
MSNKQNELLASFLGIGGNLNNVDFDQILSGIALELAKKNSALFVDLFKEVYNGSVTIKTVVGDFNTDALERPKYEPELYIVPSFVSFETFYLSNRQLDAFNDAYANAGTGFNARKVALVKEIRNEFVTSLHVAVRYAELLINGFVEFGSIKYKSPKLPAA